MKYKFLLVLLWVAVKIFANQRDTVFIQKDIHQTICNGQESYFFSSQNLPIESVVTQWFKPKKNLHLYITGNIWVKFIIKNNSSNEHFVFSVSDGHISGLYLYKKINDKYLITPPKRFHSEDGREIRNRLPAFYIDLKKGETQTFFLKITPENEVVNFTYIIQDYTSYLEAVQIDYFIIGLYLGALLIIICVNLFYFYSLKDIIFLVYAVYVLGSLLLSATLDGFMWLLIPDPEWAYHANFFCLRFWSDSLLFFIMQLVSIKKYNKNLNAIGYLFIIYHTVFVAIIELINPFNVRAYFMAQWEGVNWILSLVLASIIIIKSKNHNRYLYRYYSVLFIILLSAFIFYMVLHMDKGAHYLLFEHGMKIVALLEILTLSFAVSRRFRLTEQELKRKHNDEKLLTDRIKQLAMDVRKTQMNPHFMFNALTSIQYFIMKHNAIQAKNYLEKFALLMRLTLDNSRNSFNPLQDELKSLTYYIELEFLRMKSASHDFEIRVDRNIDPEKIHVPGLLIQPFVENAIWHGLQHKDEAGKLLIHFSLHESELQCTIEDDGRGIQPEKSKPYHKSSGIQITKERLSLIHSSLGSSFRFRFMLINLNDSNENQTGVRVSFNIPYITSNSFIKQETGIVG